MPGGALGYTLGPTTQPGSLGNRITPPSYSNVATNTGTRTVSPPAVLGHIQPQTPTGTTVDRFGNVLPAVGQPGGWWGTANSTAFNAAGFDVTWLMLILAAIVVLALVFLL